MERWSRVSRKVRKNRVALRSLLQAHAFQVTMEDVLGLSDHLAGNRRLIVNAFLQHGGDQRARIPFCHLENEIHFHYRAERRWNRWTTIKVSHEHDGRNRATAQSRRSPILRIFLWLLLVLLVGAAVVAGVCVLRRACSASAT